MQANIRDHTFPLGNTPKSSVCETKSKISSSELEENLTSAYIMVFVKVASLNDLKHGEMKSVEVQEKEICLAKVNGNFCAIGNRCTHANCLLSGGTLEGSNVKCPCHFSVFNVQTSAVAKGPATKPEPTYQIKLENDQILIDV